jgi:hypothetical protein
MARQQGVTYWLTTVLERNNEYLDQIPVAVLTARFTDEPAAPVPNQNKSLSPTGLALINPSATSVVAAST